MDGPVDESSGCSCRRTGFHSLHPHGSLQLFVTHPGDLTPSSGCQRYCIHSMYRHTSRRNTHPHKLKKKKSVKYITVQTISRTFDLANLKLWACSTSLPSSSSCAMHLATPDISWTWEVCLLWLADLTQRSSMLYPLRVPSHLKLCAVPL